MFSSAKVDVLLRKDSNPFGKPGRVLSVCVTGSGDKDIRLSLQESRSLQLQVQAIIEEKGKEEVSGG
jgi:hypothetical protein